MDIKNAIHLGKINQATHEQQDVADGGTFLKILKGQNRDVESGGQGRETSLFAGLKGLMIGKNGEKGTSEEVPLSKENRLTAALKGLMGKKALKGPDEPSVENGGKISLLWKNGEISKAEDPNNNMVNLQDVLGIRQSEISSNGDSGDAIDLFQLSNVKGGDSKNLVRRITDYLIQNGIKNLDSLEVLVEHEDLGRFKIDARRVDAKNLIDLRIEVETREGRDFFHKHEGMLNRQLTNSGINLQDLKIVESKESVLLNSLFFKEDTNQFLRLDNNVRDQNNRSQQEGREKDKRQYYANDNEYMNEEEDNA